MPLYDASGYSGKRVLVTGGAGAIGSNLTRALAEAGFPAIHPVQRSPLGRAFVRGRVFVRGRAFTPSLLGVGSIFKLLGLVVVVQALLELRDAGSHGSGKPGQLPCAEEDEHEDQDRPEFGYSRECEVHQLAG